MLFFSGFLKNVTFELSKRKANKEDILYLKRRKIFLYPNFFFLENFIDILKLANVELDVVFNNSNISYTLGTVVRLLLLLLMIEVVEVVVV